MCGAIFIGYFSFANFAGQASQKGKELEKERKEKGSLGHKEKARN